MNVYKDSTKIKNKRIQRMDREGKPISETKHSALSGEQIIIAGRRMEPMSDLKPSFFALQNLL